MDLNRVSNSFSIPSSKAETYIASESASLFQNEFVIAGHSNTANFNEESNTKLYEKLEALELENINLAGKVRELQAELNVQSIKLEVEKEENILLFHSCKELEEQVISLEMNLKKSRLQSEQNIGNIQQKTEVIERARNEELEATHLLVEASLKERNNSKSQIEYLETQIMTIVEYTREKIDSLKKEFSSSKKKLHDENNLLRKELKLLRALNYQLNNNVKEMEQSLRERQKDVVDLQNILEFGRNFATSITLDVGTSRSTIREDSRKSRDSMRAVGPLGPGKFTADNWCFLYKDSRASDFSKEDEKFEKSENTSDNKSIKTLPLHSFTKEKMLKVFVYLTAAAVKYNFPDVEIEKSVLIQLADAIPFWDLHNSYTRFLKSLREKDAKKVSKRSKQQRLFGWIR